MIDFISASTVFVDLEAESSNEVLQVLGKTLYDEGFVSKEYAEAAILREKNFPTGLNVGGSLKVAIPHADSALVKKSHLAFASLKRPVCFYDIGDPKGLLEVHLVFMLAVKDPKKHAEVLQKLMEIVQSQQKLEKLRQCSSQEEIKNILMDELI